MSEEPGPELPARLRARLEMEASAFVSLIARYDGLQIKAPFGELIFAYAPGTAVTEDATGRIQLAVDGTTLSLLIADPSERSTLFAFLQEVTAKNQQTS